LIKNIDSLEARLIEEHEEIQKGIGYFKKRKKRKLWVFQSQISAATFTELY
jgi:hypothetical protein